MRKYLPGFGIFLAGLIFGYVICLLVVNNYKTEEQTAIYNSTQYTTDTILTEEYAQLTIDSPLVDTTKLTQ